MALSPRHRQIRTLISGAAFHDVHDPAGLADAGRILSAIIRRKGVFVEPATNPTSPADSTELRLLVRRAYHDGCRRHPDGGYNGPQPPHTLENCDPEGQRFSNETADEIFAAIGPYLAHRQAREG